MTDNADIPPVETKRPDALKKFVLTLVILGVLWLILIYVIPYVARISGVPTNFRENAAGEPAAQEVIEQKNQQIDQLNGRIDQLEDKLKTFEDVIAGMPKSPGDGTPDARMAAIQAKIDNLSQAPAGSTEDNERVTELEDKVGEQQKALNDMKAQITDAQTKGMHELAVITVFGQIKDAIGRGDSFTDLLTQLKTLTPEVKEAQDLLAQLEISADKGMVTLPILQNAFEATVPVALSPGVQTGSLLGNLYSLIRIRRVGGQQLGDDDESVIARAEAKLNRGDVNGCVKELAQLSPPAATAFATWNNQAQAYVRLHEMLDALQVALISPNITAPATAPVTAFNPPPVVPAAPAVTAPAPLPVPAVAPVVKAVPAPQQEEPEADTEDAPVEAAEPADKAGR